MMMEGSPEPRVETPALSFRRYVSERIAASVVVLWLAVSLGVRDRPLRVCPCSPPESSERPNDETAVLPLHEHVARAFAVPAGEHRDRSAALEVGAPDHRGARLRGRDSNPNFPVQSRTSYH
jgi:hypothetical protein